MEIGDASITGDPCRDVVRQLVRRIQRDADVAHLISPFTTTGERLIAALVAVEGMTDAEAREAIRYGGRERPRVVALSERVEELEEMLDRYAPEWRSEESEVGRG